MIVRLEDENKDIEVITAEDLAKVLDEYQDYIEGMGRMSFEFETDDETGKRVMIIHYWGYDIE